MINPSEFLFIRSFQEAHLPEKVDVIVSEWMVRFRSVNTNLYGHFLTKVSGISFVLIWVLAVVLLYLPFRCYSMFITVSGVLYTV